MRRMPIAGMVAGSTAVVTTFGPKLMPKRGLSVRACTGEAIARRSGCQRVRAERQGDGTWRATEDTAHTSHSKVETDLRPAPLPPLPREGVPPAGRGHALRRAAMSGGAWPVHLVRKVGQREVVKDG